MQRPAYIVGMQEVQAACNIERNAVAPTVPLQLPSVVMLDCCRQVATCIPTITAAMQLLTPHKQWRQPADQMHTVDDDISRHCRVPAVCVHNLPCVTASACQALWSPHLP